MSDPFEEVDREHREALRRAQSARQHPSARRVADGKMLKAEHEAFALIAQSVGYCTFCERGGNVCDHVFCPVHRTWGKDNGSGTSCCWE